MLIPINYSNLFNTVSWPRVIQQQNNLAILLATETNQEGRRAVQNLHNTDEIYSMPEESISFNWKSSNQQSMANGGSPDIKANLTTPHSIFYDVVFEKNNIY